MVMSSTAPSSDAKGMYPWHLCPEREQLHLLRLTWHVTCAVAGMSAQTHLPGLQTPLRKRCIKTSRVSVWTEQHYRKGGAGYGEDSMSVRHLTSRTCPQSPGVSFPEDRLAEVSWVPLLTESSSMAGQRGQGGTKH